MTGLYEQIKTDLGYLQLKRAGEAFAPLADDAKAHDWTHIEFLARLLDEEAAHTRNRRLAARLRYAKFPFRKTIDDFDFEFQPSVDRKLVDDLASLRFIDENRPILFLGQPGCGKTHLAVALATRAVEAGYRGYFTTAQHMTEALVAAKIDGTWTSKLKTYVVCRAMWMGAHHPALHRRGGVPTAAPVPVRKRKQVQIKLIHTTSCGYCLVPSRRHRRRMEARRGCCRFDGTTPVHRWNLDGRLRRHRRGRRQPCH